MDKTKIFKLYSIKTIMCLSKPKNMLTIMHETHYTYPIVFNNIKLDLEPMGVVSYKKIGRENIVMLTPLGQEIRKSLILICDKLGIDELRFEDKWK